ncbi:glycosyltransferase family 2 protein [uncultured Ruminococcus sp.]|uniref:glycosyltransferase family 2 protein n=1 Tax=uncultured Ruminococcus sp. TaxID=165186 RepID=UPI00258BBB4D|nr:glycosyltransferase family 2 protein [uncultured Ruminococcus sp.]
MDKPILTVFTPAYNRADLLTRCYESMCKQTNKNFIWMIVDDGSTDNTREISESWVKNTKDFKVIYIYKENGGLHTAYNTAIASIDTELCVCIDSDDFMPDNAVELILDFWEKNGSDKYAGIVGLDFDMDGNVIGDMLPDIKSVNLIGLFTGKYNIVNGDRTNVVRTELYKKYAPMKVFKGEKNFNPHYMHLQISEEYDFLVLNENLRFVDYQETGMTNSMLKQYRSSPNSFAEIRKLYLSFKDTSLKFKIKHSIHLASSCILAKKTMSSIKDNPYKLLSVIALPFGFALSLIVRCKG